MNVLRTLKKLVLGETWVLPIGLALVIALSGLVIRPRTGATWDSCGGFIMLAGVLTVLVISVARGTRRP